MSTFYRTYGKVLLIIAAVTYPILQYESLTIPTNNDIETWLPKHTEVRKVYEQFKADFGIDEVILVAMPRKQGDQRIIEGICGRLDRLPGVRRCYSVGRLSQMMQEFGVSEKEARERLVGLNLSDDMQKQAIVVLLTDEGVARRSQLVGEIRSELDYCQLRGDAVWLTGSSVIVTELDRLGGQVETVKFFLVTLCVSALFLYYGLRDWKLTGAILLLTIWGINLTMSIMKWTGGELNFILAPLGVMVMIFTLEAAIHVVHYYKSSLGHEDPLGRALKLCWQPCVMAMLTTVIGLFSVSVSQMLPVTQFGTYSGVGAIIAVLVGLGLTPAVLVYIPVEKETDAAASSAGIRRVARWLFDRPVTIVATSVIACVVGLYGLTRLESRIDPIEFLPAHDKAWRDIQRVTAEITPIDSIELIYDFGVDEIAFTEKLNRIRDVQKVVAAHPNVRHTMSLATLFPKQLPENPFELMQVLSKADSKKSNNEFLAEDQRLWRISARVRTTPGKTVVEVYQDLQKTLAGMPVKLTGVAPLLQQAQVEIFEGFWTSFTSAFVVISIVMTISLMSIRTAALAMLPNVLPIGVIFGLLGLLKIPVDIGMMMTGSIVLGISVDGTFHYLTRYQEQLKMGRPSARAARHALLSTGGPIFESVVVSSLGMLALRLSSFAPTGRFGTLMAVLLMMALVSDLILLPALLSLADDPQAMRNHRERRLRIPQRNRTTRRIDRVA